MRSEQNEKDNRVSSKCALYAYIHDAYRMLNIFKQRKEGRKKGNIEGKRMILIAGVTQVFRGMRKKEKEKKRRRG